MMAMKITFIGGGNMGEAILASLLSKNLTVPNDICVSDVSIERRKYLNKQYGIAVMENNRDAVAGVDIVILAVKPQNVTDVIVDLKGHLEANQLVISIVAGVKIDTIRNGLEHSYIVRVMPNTPAQVGYGMSAWTATSDVTQAQKEQIRLILGAMGEEICFDNEEYLDMVTAVSGSGPAYVFLLAESMIGAAVDIGLSPEEAERLVFKTILGAAHLMHVSNKTPEELRKNVTSPGGTTEYALKVFTDGGFKDLVRKAISAAHNRAKELGG